MHLHTTGGRDHETLNTVSQVSHKSDGYLSREALPVALVGFPLAP